MGTYQLLLDVEQEAVAVMQIMLTTKQCHLGFQYPKFWKQTPAIDTAYQHHFRRYFQESVLHVDSEHQELDCGMLQVEPLHSGEAVI